MFWTDNMCIPVGAQNPKDAMTLMDFFYHPQVEAVVEYYNDYVCPVPGAKDVLLHPTGWAKKALAALKPEIGLPPSVTADAPTVFPDPGVHQELAQLLPVQEPGRADRVEQPVLADHRGLVTARRPRTRPGKALAPYLLSLPGGLWLLALFLVPLVVMLSLSLQTATPAPAPA